MRAYGYIRVSKEEENPENQILALKRYASENGLELIKIYMDIGISGSTPAKDRPEFKRLLQDIENEPKPVVLLVYEISRLGRSFYDTLTLVNELEKQGIVVVSVSPKESFLQSLDPSTRKLIMAIFAWVAERERELLIQRTREGLERAKREGKHIGRPPVKIDIKLVKELRAKGVSYRTIAKILNINYYTLLRKTKQLGLR